VSDQLEDFIFVMCLLGLILPAVQAIFVIVPLMCANSPGAMSTAASLGFFVGFVISWVMFGWSLHGAINVIYGPAGTGSCKEPSLTVRDRAATVPLGHGSVLSAGAGGVGGEGGQRAEGRGRPCGGERMRLIGLFVCLSLAAPSQYATVLMWINLITMPLNACRSCLNCACTQVQARSS